MAFQPIANLLLPSCPHVVDATSGITLNATGESGGIVGSIQVEGGSGSKTISAAGGGAIIWFAGTVTMADAGSTLRVGIQDVNAANGLEDGTFDVYAEFTGGGTIPTANDFNASAMTSGTKTLTQGDTVAIVVELVSRGGSDSVNVSRVATRAISGINTMGLPYGTNDLGTLSVSNASGIYAVIKFDDGTIGWIQGTAAVIPLFSVPQAFDSGSTPDEYIGTFVPAWPMQICGFGAALSGIASGDTFEAILYEDPYGTPNALVTLTPDTDIVGGAGTTESFHVFPCTKTSLAAGTTYGVAIRPTTANSINWEYTHVGGADLAVLKRALPLPSLKMAARTDQTGAFVETETFHVPLIVLDVCGLDDGTGGSGSGGTRSHWCIG